MSGNNPALNHLYAPEAITSLMSNTRERMSSLDRSQFKILVIDDNINLLHSTRALIEANGYPCLIADGGDPGLSILLSTAIDILLLDLSMPEVDGYEVLDAIREKEIATDVIVVSGEATFENATRVFREGAIDFINKPYTTNDLIQALDRVVYKRLLKINLSRLQTQLADSEKRYRFIVSNSPDIIYMVDHRGFFTFVNDRIADLLGIKPDDLVGEHFSALVHDDDVMLAEHVFNERRTGDRASRNVEFRLKCLIDDVDSKPFETNSIVIEMTSMGIYQTREDGTPFLGTYGVARDISERKKAQEMIHFQAYHDLLTRLPNRELLLDRMHLSISQATRNNTKLAVMFLDMDGFKFINDTLGHMVGDKLLQRVAHRLDQTLRDSDTISRIGGDEFSILLPELNDKQQAGLIAQKILDTFNQPIVLDKHEIVISFSIGISIFPDDADSTDQLIKNADMAMYHIKGRGKNGFEFFSDNMQSIYQYRHNIEQEIRKGLDAHQFEAFYQPQYDVIDDRVCGFEALIRWRHPEKGLINPDDFIPIAEEIGLIGEIGRFMLNQVCLQLRHWLDNGIAPVKIAVNVSTYQLAERDFDIIVCELIKKHRIPPNLLMIEITESALVSEMEQVIPRLQHLGKCGVNICIDDFGVGYSSLSYLQSLPIDTLKVDRSFLECTTQSANKVCIINAIVAMAKELDLKVIIEGVENQKQLEYVRRLGCRVVQGFMFGRPVPLDEIEPLIHPVQDR